MDDFQSLPEYQALVVAATPKAERSMGDSVIPAEPPQWKEVQSLSKSLLDQWSNELELHIFAIQAESNINGFEGFERSFRRAYELLDAQWESVQPPPDEDDPEDRYYERVNFIQELSQQPAFLDSLYRLPLASARGIGEFSARDIDISAGNVEASDEDRARCQDGLIRGAFAESETEQLQRLGSSLDALILLCSDMEALFIAKSDNTNPVSLTELVERLQICRGRFLEYAEEHLPSSQAEEVSDEANSLTDSGNAAGAAGQGRLASTGTIRSRTDVSDAFAAILRYYQVYEPSSPVRLFVVRAREFVDKSFFDLLRDLVPEHRDNLGALLAQLEKQPLAYLLSDSYARFCSGDLSIPELSIPELSIETPSTESVSAASEAPSLPADPEGPPVPVREEDQGEMDSEEGSAALDSSEGQNDIETQNAAAGQDAISTQVQSVPATHTSADDALADTAQTQLVSREQVTQLLNDIEAYYSIAEPASPIPLVLADMRKLVPKRFGELISEFRRFTPDADVAAE